MADDRIVAFALLTKGDVERLGGGFRRLYPIDETPRFAELLRAIDEAELRADPTRAPAPSGNEGAPSH